MNLGTLTPGTKAGDVKVLAIFGLDTPYLDDGDSLSASSLGPTTIRGAGKPLGFPPTKAH